MFIALIHLACNVLSRLVALDEGEGLLNFKAVFQATPRNYEGNNAPLIIAVVLCGGMLEFIVDLSLSRKKKERHD